MKTYKYKIITAKHNLDESKLNEFGRRGWELVSVLVNEFVYTYYFKTEL